MEDYKIQVSCDEESIIVQQKALTDLGYRRSDLGYRRSGIADIRQNARYIVLSNGDMMALSVNSEFYFLQHHAPEISIANFMKIGEELEEQQINNNMEIKLKCTTAPSKAKNITVGEEYEGIFVDANDNQVDTYKEATYFLCNNNAGTEARYRIELFGKPVAHRAPRAPKADRPVPPPPPPPLALPSLQQFKQGLLVERDSVSFHHNGNTGVIMRRGYGLLTGAGTNCSCGVKTVSGLTDLGDHVDSICVATKALLSEEVTLEQVCFAIFEAVLRAFGENIHRDTAFIVLSNTEDNSERYGALLNEMATPSPWRENPNSENQIKVWVMEV